MKQSLVAKMGLVLLLICAIAGLFLGVAYETTKDLIAEKKASVNQEAYQKVLPNAEQLTPLSVDASQQTDILEVYESDQGYAIKVLAKGYAGDDIEMAVGLDHDGMVTGVEVISHSETPGLGSKAAEESFLSQYVGKSADMQLTVTKTGAQSEAEIDAISGATKTTNGVTGGVNRAFTYFNEYLRGESDG